MKKKQPEDPLVVEFFGCATRLRNRGWVIVAIPPDEVGSRDRVLLEIELIKKAAGL